MSDQHPNRRTALVAAAASAAAVSTIGFTRPALAAADQSQLITLLANFKIREGQREQALKILQTLTAAVEENEPGVLAYVAHTLSSDPNDVVFFEVYDSPASIQNHSRQSHLAELRSAFGTVFEGVPNGIKRLDRVAGFVR